MIRSTLAIAAGYLSIIALNGFVRIILAVYHHSDLSFSGITSLPSDEWGYFIVGAQYLWGLLAGFLTVSIVSSQAHLETLALVLLLVGSGCIDYSMLHQNEPLWYLILSPVLKILGVLSGYYLLQQQTQTQPTGL